MRVDANTQQANLSQALSLESDRAYLLSFWRRMQDVQAEPGACAMEGGRTWFSGGTSDWEPVAREFGAGPGPGERRVALGLQAPFGTVWYDRGEVREVEELRLLTGPIALPKGASWSRAEIDADVPFGAGLVLDVLPAEPEGDRPLLRGVDVAGAVRRSLRALAHLQPRTAAVCFRFTARFGGAETDEIVVRRWRVGVVSAEGPDEQG